jgi:hypothetical protein
MLRPESPLRYLAPLSLLVIAIAQLWPGLSAGLSPPISWDHGSHLGKAALVAEELLPWIRGWSDRVEAGVPQSTLYTATGTLWILLFRLFTPFLEWHQTYALAFVGFRALTAFAVYRLARVARAGQLGAIVGGMLMLADWGDHSEGGWFYDVIFGVWPMALAMTIFFIGFADLLTYLEQGRRAQGARAMLLLGIALFSHQASLLALGSIVPALLMIRAVEQPHLRRDVGRMTGILIVAGLIACWWTLPMLANSAWLDDHGQLYRSAPDIGARFVAGQGILNGGLWTGPLVGLALIASVFSSGNRRVYAAGALVAMLISSPGWLLELDMVRWMPSLGRIMFPRMMMIAKPLAFALAGCLLSDVFAQVAAALKKTWSGARGKLSIALTLVLLAPFLVDAPAKIDELLIHRDVAYTSTLPDWNDRRAVWDWMRERPQTPFFRVFYYDESTHLPQAAPAFSGHPGIIHGILVGEAFRNTVDSIDPNTLRAINVRYVVSAGPPPGALRSEVHEVASFGGQRIYELRDFRSGVASDAGSGRALHVTNLERERVVFEPNGAELAVVHRAFAPGWRAYADGSPIEIEPSPVPGSARLRLMRMRIPEGTRRVELRYGSLLLPTALGLFLTTSGLFVVALFLAWPRLPERFVALLQAVYEKVQGRTPTWIRANGHRILIALPFIGVAVVLTRGASGTHLAYALEDARVSISHRDGHTEECSANGEAFECASTRLRVERTTQIVDGRFHGCITAHPPSSGSLVIEWDRTALRSTLHIGAGISDEVHANGLGAPVRVRVSLDGTERATLTVPNGREWVEETLSIESGEHALRFEINADDPFRRWLCFDAISR